MNTGLNDQMLMTTQDLQFMYNLLSEHPISKQPCP